MKTKSHDSMKIKSHDSNVKKLLLDEKKHLIVPFYQRPYKWNNKDDDKKKEANKIEPFMTDIIESFESSKGEEDYFIGTIHLSKREKENEYDIIDGQQRITTILVLLKELKLLCPNNENLKNLKFNQLETLVNGGLEQKCLLKYFESEKPKNKVDENNQYEVNGEIIRSCLIDEENDGEERVNLPKFINYIRSHLVFIVIETQEKPSKTIKMFNRHNTGGLPLEFDEAFKIRMYEYMTDPKEKNYMTAQKETDVASRIDKTYTLCKQKGEKVNCDMNYVLYVYQLVLIKKYHLSKDLFDIYFTADANTNDVNDFFDGIFDALMGIKVWDGFEDVTKNKVKIDLKEIEGIINAMYTWHTSDEIKGVPPEGYFAYKMILKSRCAASFNAIDELYLFYHKNDIPGLYKVLCELNKLFFIYSVYFSERNKTKDFIYELLMNLDKPCSKIIEFISKQKNNSEIIKKNKLEEYLKANIYDQGRPYSLLICRMAEYFAIKSKTTEKIKKVLFNDEKENVQIEHIQSRSKAKEWGVKDDDELLNSIGNLTLLESSINESIGNAPFPKKQLGYKEGKSKYPTIQKLSNLPQNAWTKEDAENRRDEVVGKIMEYLFS